MLSLSRFGTHDEHERDREGREGEQVHEGGHLSIRLVADTPAKLLRKCDNHIDADQFRLGSGSVSLPGKAERMRKREAERAERPPASPEEAAKIDDFLRRMMRPH